MTIALVGTSPAILAGAAVNTAVQPGWGTSQNRTAGNLLILQVAGAGVTTLPTTPAGWTLAFSGTGTSCCAAVYYRIATGADVAPTVAALASQTWIAKVNEYSGNAAVPLDLTSTAVGASGTAQAFNSGPDATAGDLAIAAGSAFYSVAGTKTLGQGFGILGNVGAVVSTGASSRTSHAAFAYSLSTGNTQQQSCLFSYTNTNATGAVEVLVTFKPAVPPISVVGNPGAVQTVTTTSTTPPFGQATTAGNLLVAFITDNATTANQVTTASPGWLKVGTGSFRSGIGNTYIFYKQNCGASETAPTFTLTGNTSGFAQCVEFSGAATSVPLDAISPTSGTATPMTNTAGTTDRAIGSLIVSADMGLYSTSAARTITSAYNNGAGANYTAANSTVSTTRFYEFACGWTTLNSGADIDTSSMSVATNLTGMVSMMASFSTVSGSTSATASPTSISCVTSVPAPAGSASSQAAPVAIGCITTVPAVTIVTGIVILTTSISCITTVGSSTPNTASTTTPASISSVTTVPAETPDRQPPVTVLCVTTVSAPTVNIGYSVSPVSISCVTTLNASTPNTASTVAPTSISCLTTVPVTAPTRQPPVTIQAVTTVPVTQPNRQPPVVIPCLTTVPSPTISAGNTVTVVSANISCLTTIGASTPTTSSTVIPISISCVTTLGAPIITVGANVNVLPVVMACVTTIPAPIVNISRTATPLTIGSLTLVGFVTPTSGSTVSPTSILAVVTLSSPTITVGLLVVVHPIVIACLTLVNHAFVNLVPTPEPILTILVAGQGTLVSVGQQLMMIAVDDQEEDNAVSSQGTSTTFNQQGVS